MQRLWSSVLVVYGMIGTLMAASSYPESLVSVTRYKLQVLWFLPETSKARLDALLIDGHLSLFDLYIKMEYISFALILLAAGFGMFWGYKDPASKKLLAIKSVTFMSIALFVLYAMNQLLQKSLDELAHSGMQLSLGLSAMPLYWFVGLVASAAVTGHYVALGSHDAALVLRPKIKAFIG